AVLDGWGGPQLLDSYQIERKPVAVTSMTTSSQIYTETISLPAGAALAEDSADGEVARTRFKLAFVNMRPASEPITEQIKLGYCYEDSPIVCHDGTVGPPENAATFIPSARPGTRAPHVWLEPG